ncbi:MAG: hypothetical protein QOI80_2277 [Solirubrobacteraceae bacterium]|nr:hypothetical protein [Solirubrobacteraceae bacterium]
MHVEIWSDLACPWCYVGKRRFEAALARFEDADAVTVTYRAFELDPEAPAERAGPIAEHLARKYGITPERARELNDQLTAIAAADGIEMRYDRVRSGNTLDAHRVVALAAAHGRQADMVERLFRAYFTDGELLSDQDVLRRLAVEVGLPGEETDALLAGDGYTDAVRADEQLARAIGIQAVPFYAVDRRIGAAGAQDPEVLLDMLREIGRRSAA